MPPLATGLKLDIALKVSLRVEFLPINLASTTLLDDSLAASLLCLLVLGLRLHTGLVVRVEAHHHRAVLQRVNLASHLPHLILWLGVTHDALDLMNTESEQRGNTWRFTPRQRTSFRYPLATFIAFKY